jgi:hypothetical protein
MTIFNIELFGADADWFCNLTKSDQFAWIKVNTNQVNDDLINEFLGTPLKNKKEYCFTCRDNKQRVSIAKIVEDGNISKGNEQEVEPTSERTNVKNSRKRRNS